MIKGVKDLGILGSRQVTPRRANNPMMGICGWQGREGRGMIR